jgi:hypothetical protein
VLSIPTGPTGKVLKRRIAQLAERWMHGQPDDAFSTSLKAVRLPASSSVSPSVN